jgi:hypothetical protein
MAANRLFSFQAPVIVSQEPIQLDMVAASEGRNILAPGKFGSQYPRMLFLKDGRVLCVYTVYRNQGYLLDAKGGTTLVVAESTDGAASFKELVEIADFGRDLDNGMLMELSNGTILLACRSVRWQESYRLPVYESTDGGSSFHVISMLDRNEGVPGELGSPDRGIYEPHLLILSDGSIAAQYANERYALAPHAYSQIISEKISTDNGHTWQNEIVVCADDEHPDARPGMPVFVRMKDGRYITVYEICGSMDALIYYKVSEDGKTWPSGIGKHIPLQRSGPFIECLEDGTLVVTSNSQQLSVSMDNGESFYAHRPAPWGDLDGKPIIADAVAVVNKSVWPCIYALPGNRALICTSLGRAAGGHLVIYRVME